MSEYIPSSSPLSASFPERWYHSSPELKKIIYDELDDAITLLTSNVSIREFAFSEPALNASLHALQTQHLNHIQQKKTATIEAKASEIIPQLEIRIDDLISDRMSELSVELKSWLHQVVREELAKQTKL